MIADGATIGRVTVQAPSAKGDVAWRLRVANQLSGLELCRRLKQDARTSGIPAIMLTARGYHLEPHDTEQSGILRMLSKPFSPRHLLSTVTEVLEGKAA